MIENILIVDTETTGLNPDKGDKVIEIAAILFNLKYKTALQHFSTLLPCDENPVENINHIKAEVTRCNFSILEINTILLSMLNSADACVAHNAQFDKRFIATLSVANNFFDKKWICTKANFTWPVQLNRFRLQDICLAMKVPYLHAHRALVDCMLLAQCFEKIDDLEERFSRCTI